MTVVGIDACKKGWIVVTLGEAGPAAHFIPMIEYIVDVVPDVSTIAIDIPIGLPEHGRRDADQLARDFVGPRRSSVFFVPVREAFTTEDFADANRVSVALGGSRLSKQSYALREKFLEVDAWFTQAPCQVFEVHPEVSFRRLVGVPIEYSKKSWAGMTLRRRALKEAGIDVDEIANHAGERAGVDDLLDAAVAAWSAGRIERDVAESLPQRAHGYSARDGQTIWF